MKAGSPSRNVDVVVVGGGIAGLVATYDLHRAGLRVVLCEAGMRLGGLIHTEDVSGCVIEGGPDSMLAQKPAALALCQELGLGDQLISTLEPRTAFVLRDGALHPIPSDSVLGLPVTADAIEQCTMLSADGRASLARDLTAPSSTPHGGGDQSIGNFVRRHFDDEVVRFLTQPLLGGIHAGDVERLSIQALFPTLLDADAPGLSLLRTLAERRRGADPDGAFRSLRGGMSVLVARLAAQLPQSSIRLATAVTRVRNDPAFTIDTASGSISAAAAVLAVPAPQAARLLASVDVDLAQSLSDISYASTATITLAYREEDVAGKLHGTGFVVPRLSTSSSRPELVEGRSAASSSRIDPSTRLLAASWVTSKWPARAPPDIVLLRAFAGGVLDADLLDLDDEALVTLAHRDLSALLEIRGRPLFTRTYRWPNAGPQYEVGHTARVARIEAAAARWPGLWLTGSAFRGVGIPDCVADARATAARVSAAFADRRPVTDIAG